MATQGFRQYVGIDAMRDDADQVLGVALDIRPEHLNANKMVHGSVIHALLDTVMGMVCFRANGRQPVATAEMTVRYLEPVWGGRVEASARVIRGGKRLFVLEGMAYRAGDGQVVAIAQGTFVPVRRHASAP